LTIILVKRFIYRAQKTNVKTFLDASIVDGKLSVIKHSSILVYM